MKSLIPDFEMLLAGAVPLVAAKWQEIGLRNIIDRLSKDDQNGSMLFKRLEPVKVGKIAAENGIQR